MARPRSKASLHTVRSTRKTTTDKRVLEACSPAVSTMACPWLSRSRGYVVAPHAPCALETTHELRTLGPSVASPGGYWAHALVCAGCEGAGSDAGCGRCMDWITKKSAGVRLRGCEVRRHAGCNTGCVVGGLRWPCPSSAGQTARDDLGYHGNATPSLSHESGRLKGMRRAESSKSRRCRLGALGRQRRRTPQGRRGGKN